MPRPFIMIAVLTVLSSLNAPAALGKTVSTAPRETLTLGGGCFWCVDAVFRRTRGVVQSTCGYAGGKVANPSYEAVCRGGTGHIEVVQVSFEPGRISRENILRIFLGVHDPTSRDRQGADAGEQYRSVIFWHLPAQREAANRMMQEWSREHPGKGATVTEVRPLDHFWAAEAYHQNYFEKNPEQPYCVFVVAPKVRKFLDTMGDLAR